MEQVKDLSTAGALRTLSIHLGLLLFVIFPVGFVVLVVVKFILSLIFGVSGTESGLLWLSSSPAEAGALDRIESCALMNCAAAYVALIVFMIRALLRMGELPSSKSGIITLHLRLGFRMIALPLLTVVICAFTALGIYLTFTTIDSFVDIYMTLAWVVLLPTTIGTWIWVWRGSWITSISSVAPSGQEVAAVTSEPRLE